MKKIGYLCLTIAAFIVAYILQYAATFFMMAMSFIFSGIAAIAGVLPLTNLYNIWMDTNFNVIILIIFSLSCSCTFGLWYHHRCEGNFLPDVKSTFHPAIIASIVILVPGAQFASSILTFIVSTVFPGWLEAYEELLENTGLIPSSLSPLIVCYAVLLGPISEELIFRGVIMRYARLVFPFWLANIFQAVLFGVFHGNMIQGCYAAAFGLILGYICERGGSIYFSILLHMLYNFWGTVLSEFLYTIEMDELLAGIIIIVVMVVSLSVGFVLFHVGCSSRARKSAARTTERWIPPSN